MLTRPQQILIKRAQREAGPSDAEYREALAIVSGCQSSKDARLTDRHLDLALAYFEAIYWCGVDSGRLQPPCKPDAVFRQRRFWANKNTRLETSRDRFVQAGIGEKISNLEFALAKLGFDEQYCAAIREKVAPGPIRVRADYLYKAALERTLRAKQRKFGGQLAVC
jgi:hypothetical protein